MIPQQNLDSQPEKPFDYRLLYDALKETYIRYSNNVFTTIGVVVLAIGWIITSPESRDFLEMNNWAYFISLVAIVLIAAIHTMVLLGAYRASNKLVDLLSEKHGIGTEYTFFYEVTKVKVGGSLVLDLVLFLVLFVLIWSLR